MKISVGTQSVLWGVHAFWWHPLTVALAFCRVHKRLPALWELVGIALHDIGYWAKTDLDGPSGVTHPYFGAEIAGKIVDLFSKQKGWQVRYLCLYHSLTFAKLARHDVSDLYLPDKCSILIEPRWWYLFRARLSGEIKEYVANSPYKDADSWYVGYRKSVERKFYVHRNH